MSQAIAVVEALKRALKAKKQTYAHVARELKMSEATVKRMFSSHHFTLERFEQVCQIAGLGLTIEFDCIARQSSHPETAAGRAADRAQELAHHLEIEHGWHVAQRGSAGREQGRSHLLDTRNRSASSCCSSWTRSNSSS